MARAFRIVPFFLLGVIVVAVVVIAGLSYRTRSAPPAEPAAGEFGGMSLKIEYATSSAARERGLGGRTSIPGDFGMLFIFPNSDFYGFWMKDMFVPIDIFWLDDSLKVISFVRDVATSTYPYVFYPPVPAHYVLETAAGFARTHAIATGTPLILKNISNVSL